VLSPAFFSRLVHYTHIAKAFDQESIFTDEKNRTVMVSQPDLLPSLFYTEDQLKTNQTQTSALDRIRWSIQQRLRCPPASPAYLLPMPDIHVKNLPVNMKDIVHIMPSNLDCFVRSSCGDGWVYRRLCIRLFIAQRFFGGFADLVDLGDVLLRLLLIYLALQMSFVDGAVHSKTARGNLLNYLIAVLVINAANVWASGKGC
jgi:hypothetical protein